MYNIYKQRNRYKFWIGFLNPAILIAEWDNSLSGIKSLLNQPELVISYNITEGVIDMLRPALFNNRTYKPMFFDDSFDQMFDNAFKNFWGNNELATFDAFKTDVIDQGDSYLLQAELPGFDKSDINIDLKDNLLTISASHKEEKNEEDKNKYIRKERYYSSYSRSFRVNDVEAGDIDASYNNGILEVKFPKKEIAAKEDIKKIEVK